MMVPFHFSIDISSPSCKPYEHVPSPMPFSPFSSSSSRRNERGTVRSQSQRETDQVERSDDGERVWESRVRLGRRNRRSARFRRPYCSLRGAPFAILCVRRVVAERDEQPRPDRGDFNPSTRFFRATGQRKGSIVAVQCRLPRQIAISPGAGA